MCRPEDTKEQLYGVNMSRGRMNDMAIYAQLHCAWVPKEQISAEFSIKSSVIAA